MRRRSRSRRPSAETPAAAPASPALPWPRDWLSAPVLVTGAAGYGASRIVSALCDAGFSCVRAADLPGALDRAWAAGALDARAARVPLDVCDAAACAVAARGARAVVHAAAVVPFNLGARVPDAVLARVNVGGTANVLAASAAAGALVFVHISSTGAVFTGADVAGADEASADAAAAAAGALNDAYSATKAAAEAAVLAADAAGAARMATLALRPHAGLL